MRLWYFHSIKLHMQSVGLFSTTDRLLFGGLSCDQSWRVQSMCLKSGFSSGPAQGQLCKPPRLPAAEGGTPASDGPSLLPLCDLPYDLFLNKYSSSFFIFHSFQGKGLFFYLPLPFLIPFFEMFIYINECNVTIMLNNVQRLHT